MRTSALYTAAFAGCALSSPLIKRDPVLEIDTVFDVVYVTAYVTETAGATPVASVSSTVVPSVESSSIATTSSSVLQNGFYNNRHSWAWTSTYVSSQPAVTSEAASSVVSSVEQAASSTSASVVQSTSVYVAPSTSSSSVYVASTTSIPATTSSAADTSAAAQATTYQQRVVLHHNVHRANHSAPNIAWSQDLADTAQTIAESCVYAHNVNTNGGGYGQNIAAGVAPNNISAVITDLFYNGEVNYFNGLYGQANPDMTNFENWGHFSQIVWKDTTQVGCATVDCSSSGLSNVGSYVSPYFTVCNYKSPGNYGGEYADNIGASLKKATVGWNYGL